MSEATIVFKAAHKKQRANKRQHKARRIRELLKEQRALTKASTREAKRDDRRLSRIEAAFEGCSSLEERRDVQ